MTRARTRVGVLIATALTAALIAVVVLASASGSRRASGEMAGMAGMAGMTGTAMGAMHELQPGADGTRPSAAGLTLVPSATRLAPGHPHLWRFTVTDRRGRPITRYQLDATKRVHLIVVRDDLTHYQHLHPTLAGDGTFSIALTLPAPGRYRAIADFTTAGRRYALETALTAPGRTTTRALPGPGDDATVDDYHLRLTHGPLFAGRAGALVFAITRAGRPVGDLQTYLGAYGHLVALRQGTLAYSHVHPDATNLRQGEIGFSADLPARARYRLFLQFRAGDRVHTAAFTVDAR